MNWGHILFGFSGRINRAKWWLSVLATIVIGIVLAIVSGLLSTVSSVAENGVFIISQIITFWISLAAGAKRLHDLNRTGAWLVVFYVLPTLMVIALLVYIGMSLGMDVLTNEAALERALTDPQTWMRWGAALAIFGLLTLAFMIWALVWFGCLRGSVGPNRFGPDPLEGRFA